MSFIAWINSIWHAMPLHDNSDETTATPSTTSPPTAGGKAPRKALSTKGPRVQKGPARPYKKHETEALKTRASTMRRKIELLKSKTVILQDRLDLHVAELSYREPDNVGCPPENA